MTRFWGLGESNTGLCGDLGVFPSFIWAISIGGASEVRGIAVG
jgi:hypothetical protein